MSNSDTTQAASPGDHTEATTPNGHADLTSEADVADVADVADFLETRAGEDSLSHEEGWRRLQDRDAARDRYFKRQRRREIRQQLHGAAAPDLSLLDPLEDAVWDREGEELSGDEIQFRCPLPDHEDVHPSARFNAVKGVWYCDVCGIGGGADDLAVRLEVEPPELTLAVYAEAKKMPLDFLQRLGLEEVKRKGRVAIRMPYRREDGTEAAVRYRLRLTGRGRFEWSKGDSPCLYGLDSLHEARAAGFVTLCEGESDSQTCWLHDEPALGIPGATNFKPERDVPLLQDIPVIYVIQEPDRGGRQLRERLLNSTLRERVRVIDLSPFRVKDPSGLHTLDPDQFQERWAAAKAAAEPLVAAVAAVAARLQNGAGASVLAEVEAYLRKYVVYPSSHAAVAHTLWLAHTHAMDAWDSTPRLAFLSPEPSSGKTRGLEASEGLIPHPIHTVNCSTSYLFRKISDQANRPTVLFDEVDTIFGPKATEHEELRGLLNAGHRRGAMVGRSVIVAQTVQAQDFPAYAAVALAGLGDLPETIVTRSIELRMRRRAPGEYVKPFRQREALAEAKPLQDQLARWMQAVTPQFGNPWPEMPLGVEDRDADKWEPLLAVAEAAGGDWPARARAAAMALVAESKASSSSLGIRLLGDLRSIFGERDFLTTADIVTTLTALDEAPWSEINKGKPLNARGLAGRLRPFEIASHNERVGEQMLKGYSRADFVDAWARYLPPVKPEGEEPLEGSETPLPHPPPKRPATSATAATPSPNGAADKLKTGLDAMMMEVALPDPDDLPPERRCAEWVRSRLCGAPIPDDVPGFYCPKHGGQHQTDLAEASAEFADPLVDELSYDEPEEIAEPADDTSHTTPDDLPESCWQPDVCGAEGLCPAAKRGALCNAATGARLRAAEADDETREEYN